MVKRMGFWIFSTLACALIFVSIAVAHDVSFRDRMKVGNGPELQPGAYRIEVEKNGDSADVRFFQAGDLVVTASARLSKESSKCSATEIHSEIVDSGRVITKICLQGWNESLAFKEGASKAD